MPRASKLPLPSKQYLRDVRWIGNHLDELVRKYPNQYVAVFKGSVVAAGTDLGKVDAAARRKVGDREIATYFVDDGTIILHLSRVTDATHQPAGLSHRSSAGAGARATATGHTPPHPR